jgi:hypothetical protein
MRQEADSTEIYIAVSDIVAENGTLGHFFDCNRSFNGQRQPLEINVTIETDVTPY